MLNKRSALTLNLRSSSRELRLFQSAGAGFLEDFMDSLVHLHASVSLPADQMSLKLNAH